MRRRSLPNWIGLTSSSYQKRPDEPVLRVGKDVITFREFNNEFPFPHLTAARRLNREIQKFKPKSVRELAARLSPDELLLRCHTVGEITMMMWMFLLERSGLNPDRWYDRHTKISTLCAKVRKKR